MATLVTRAGALSADQAHLLQALAHGQPRPRLQQQLGISAPDLKRAELDLCRALQARHVAHAVARGFELGLLRYLCVVLVIGALGDEPLRLRTARRPIRSTTVVRLVARTGGGASC